MHDWDTSSTQFSLDTSFFESSQGSTQGTLNCSKAEAPEEIRPVVAMTGKTPEPITLSMMKHGDALTATAMKTVVTRFHADTEAVNLSDLVHAVR